MEKLWNNFTIFFEANQALIIWLGSSSAFFFIVTLAALPLIIIRIPEDYFKHKNRSIIEPKHPALRLLLLILKNLWGYIFILVGFILLFVPGQGLLTIFIGIMLIDFPRKYQFECWLVRKKFILQSLNWIRKRNNKPALRIRERG
ncbi:MAG: PGPGW domain-containing protein [Candidatus Cloacimonadales bacterium]